MINHINVFVWDVISHPFTNFKNSLVVEVRAWGMKSLYIHEYFQWNYPQINFIGPADLVDNSTLVLVRVWCHKATSQCLSQCWQISPMVYNFIRPQWVITLRLRQKGHHFPDNIFKCIFLNKKAWISMKYHWYLFLRVQITIFQHWFR